MNSSETNEEAKPIGSRFHSMQKAELEALAISAIREHRRLIVADEAVYAEWNRASSDPSVSSDIMESLQQEYAACQTKSEAQQEELSEMIEALGYIPEVPWDGNHSN
ncbi:transcriptional repressor TraM [Ensifer sp. ENS06]|uniref:transcriptional repressor TraM n=1 Tax=Ensifer sp. ENS06 TaxID=2769276 RepID=UPI0017809FF0|nr:transcriptional repressor TraM [Ensifer sp. ENS06]MBD9627961.1 transcriptional repressor TraM [Ensifer sp. ENS06]